MKSKLIEKNGKFYEKCKVAILSTHNESALFRKSSGLIEYSVFPPLHGVKSLGWKFQHLYFLSDEKIKKDDWCYIKNHYNEYYIAKYNGESFDIINDGGNFHPISQTNCFKIIATTNNNLKVCKVDRDNDETYSESLPQPSKEFIEAYVESHNNGNIIEKVLVEYEQEDGFGNTENFKTFSRYNYLKLKKDNTIITKKFEEKLFSELEIIGFLRKYKKHFNLEIDTEKELSFIESNLK